MSNSRLHIEDIFLLAKEANKYSLSEYTLLKDAVSTTETRALRHRVECTQEATRDNASFQDKLQISYGL